MADNDPLKWRSKKANTIAPTIGSSRQVVVLVAVVAIAVAAVVAL